MDKQNIFPATYVEFQGETSRRSAAFYLAAEEFLAREMPAGDYVFMWRLNPTCVYGRNQNPDVELDLDFCRRNGVEVMRRKSGGGTIFADENNIMISLVTRNGSVEDIFGQFSQTISAGLRSLGVPASVSGRNDIILDGGKKICGGAFYHLKERSIVHSTMLYDTNPLLMQGCLTPQRAKMQSKGVKSVESRIGLLKDYLTCGVEKLQEQLRYILTDRHIVLSSETISRIEEIEKPYHEAEYLFPRESPRHPKALLTLSGRIEGCGSIELKIYADAEGRLTDIAIAGDYFQSSSQNPRDAFMQALRQCHIDLARRTETLQNIYEQIHTHKPYTAIRNLDMEGIRSLKAVWEEEKQ